MHEGKQIRAQNQPWYTGIAIAIYEKTPSGIYAASEVVVTRISKEMGIPTAMTVHQNTAQLLMDDLWNCGIRPSEGSGSAGQLRATQNHLEDMRRLVFEKGNPCPNP